MNRLTRFRYVIAVLMCVVVISLQSGAKNTAILTLAQADEDTQPFIYAGFAWSPDGSVIAVGASDGIWLHSAEDLSVIERLAEQSFVTSLNWNPVNNLLASSDVDGNVFIIDVEARETIAELPLHERIITSVEWSPNGQLLASKSWDKTIQIWELETRAIYQTIDLDDVNNANVTWNADSTQVATYDDAVKIWNVETGELTLSWEYNFETTEIRWSPNGDYLVANGLSSGIIGIWIALTGELIERLDVPTSPHAITWSSDSRLIATLNCTQQCGTIQDEQVHIWEWETGRLLEILEGTIRVGDAFYSNSLLWSPDGDYLVSGGDNGVIYLWETENYALVATYDNYRLIFEPD